MPCRRPAGASRRRWPRRDSNRCRRRLGESTFERDAGRSGQLGRATRCDLVAGIERIQVRHVTLAGRRFVEVDRPLLQLAVLPI